MVFLMASSDYVGGIGICIGESNLNLPNCILEEPDWPGFQGKNCEFHRFLIAEIINESLFAVRLI